MPVPAPPRTVLSSRAPLRLLTAVPLCDGHDSAVTTINLELARHGAEVIYLGYHQSAAAIARAAIQEDVHAIGLSSYNGGHLVFFKEVLAQLRARGARDIPLFGGGGGTITPADERVMRRAGIDRIFFAGTPLDEIIATLRTYARPLKPDLTLHGDRALARAITLAEGKTGKRKPESGKNSARAVSSGSSSPVSGFRSPVSHVRRPNPQSSPERSDRLNRSGAIAQSAALNIRNPKFRPFVLGIAGPGGAGKSTLIDELTSRFLRQFPSRRLAILANDPSQPDTHGAILGDRVSAIYAQDDRVFFRSLATRGHLTGLSAAAPAAIELLRAAGTFDLVFVESVGIGQESDPFGVFGAGPKLVDATLYVLPPHYGGRIQLQKIALLNAADLVALNKCDDPRAATAKAELTARLAANPMPTTLHATIAAQHDDPGTDALFAAITQLAALEPTGGEPPCSLSKLSPLCPD